MSNCVRLLTLLAMSMLLGSCAGPLGFRVGLNPEFVAELREDPASSCIIIEYTPTGRRILWWRDVTPMRPNAIKECVGR